MKYRYLIVAGLIVLGLSLVLAACGSTGQPTSTLPAPVVNTQAPSPTAVPVKCPEPAACPEPVVKDVPNQAAWVASGHADAKAQAFIHWNDAKANPNGIPVTCAKCHSSPGYLDFLGADGSAVGVVDSPAITGTVITCATCHNVAAQSLVSVTFPSGAVISGLGPEARCLVCHQGRESKVSVDKQIAKFNATADPDKVPAPIKDANGKDVAFGFLNVHYFAAGGTLYGSETHMGYEYDGKIYDPKFRHVEGFDTCIACHDQHATQVRVEKCAECHQGVKTVDDLKNNRENGSLVDYNGNGDVKEGIFYEMKGLQDTLYSAIQAYAAEKAGAPIVYDTNTYPYFFKGDSSGGIAKDDAGNNVGYQNWTPRLLEAAYNYQTSYKDPGAFAHNAKYIIELLYDSTADLNTQLSKPIDMSKMHRDDAGHFAGNTTPFRDWDSTGMVPATCAKCHSATGLPEFLANSGTILIDKKAGAVATGVVAQPVANGFMCTTCHDTSVGFPARYAVVNVPFPSGVTLTFSTEKDDKGNLKPVDANLCLECHQGRESTVTMNNALAAFTDADKADPNIRFRNIHYFAAGATLFGDAAKGAYQYADQTYVGYNATHPLNKCTDCHDVHALNVKTDACKACHTNVNGVADLENIRMTTDNTDWNGNGDTTEGIFKEIDSFRTALYASIQSYAETKAGTPIVYDAASYPYFFVDANKDGKADTDANGSAIAYNTWTPRLLKAAYNYQYSIKDPGAFAHNPKYVMQFLYDSTKDLGGDVAKFKRP